MGSFLRFFRNGPRWGAGDRGRLTAQGISAVGTINIIHSDGSLTLRANRGELIAALRAEGESGVHDMAASGAGGLQCLPQYKVENDAQCVGNNYGHNRPQDRAHAAPPGVAVYVADEQQITTHHQADQKSEQRPRPGGRTIGFAANEEIKRDLRSYERNPRQGPCPGRNNLDFRRCCGSSFVFG